MIRKFLRDCLVGVLNYKEPNNMDKYADENGNFHCRLKRNDFDRYPEIVRVTVLASPMEVQAATELLKPKIAQDLGQFEEWIHEWLEHYHRGSEPIRRRMLEARSPSPFGWEIGLACGIEGDYAEKLKNCVGGSIWWSWVRYCGVWYGDRRWPKGWEQNGDASSEW